MIIFSDFDGTLYPHDDSTTFAQNLQAVQDFRQAGHQFCLATGRNLSSLERVWKDYSNYLDALVLDNGAICLDSHGQSILQFAIPLAVLQDITQNVLAHFADISFVAYNCDLSECSDITQAVTKARYWTLDNATATKISDFINEQYSSKVKAYPIYDCIPTRNLDFIDSRCQAFVDIASVDAGKENAIAKLSNLIAPGEHIITVGDGSNDIDMLRDFDGYAIASGDPDALAAVAPGHVVGSVGEMINKVMLQLV